VGGQPASAELLAALQSVEVEDHADLADMLRLRLATSVRDNGSGWTHVDDALFSRLAEIKVGVNLGGRVEPLIHAYVIDLRASFANQPGGSTLEVIGMDATALMNLEEKVKAWPNKTDSAIATDIFQAYGFSLDVHDTQPARQATQTTTIQRGTDIRFLKELAERNGYECYIDLDNTGQTVGHFHPPGLEQQGQTVLNVNLGSNTNVDEFKARYDMLRATTAQVTGLDVENQSAQPAQADGVGLAPLGSSATLGTDRPRRVLLSGTGLAETGELQTLAQAVVDQSAWSITAEGSISAASHDIVLQAKRPVLLRGVGTQFSGTYYVEQVLHQFSGQGYIQRFRLKRNAAGVASQDTFREDSSLPPQPARQV
jgi:phage protein D